METGSLSRRVNAKIRDIIGCDTRVTGRNTYHHGRDQQDAADLPVYLSEYFDNIPQ